MAASDVNPSPPTGTEWLRRLPLPTRSIGFLYRPVSSPFASVLFVRSPSRCPCCTYNAPAARTPSSVICRISKKPRPSFPLRQSTYTRARYRDCLIRSARSVLAEDLCRLPRRRREVDRKSRLSMTAFLGAHAKTHLSMMSPVCTDSARDDDCFLSTQAQQPSSSRPESAGGVEEFPVQFENEVT